MGVVGFHIVTCAILIVMLNVLIAIISDDFGTVLARKEQEALRQRANTVVELESVYLGGYYSSAIVRGAALTLVDYAPLEYWHWKWRVRPRGRTEGGAGFEPSLHLPVPKHRNNGSSGSRSSSGSSNSGSKQRAANGGAKSVRRVVPGDGSAGGGHTWTLPLGSKYLHVLVAKEELGPDEQQASNRGSETVAQAARRAKAARATRERSEAMAREVSSLAQHMKEGIGRIEARLARLEKRQ
jgi:hypothetical protein